MRIGRIHGLALALLPIEVWAHADHLVTPENLWRAWNSDALIVLPLSLGSVLYYLGVRRLWAKAGRGHGIARREVAAFAIGMALLAAALVSPLDALGETLLSAHMMQHGLLVTLAPILLLLAKPAVAFAWALPGTPRKQWLASASGHALRRSANALSRPLPAATLHGLALWAWHAPGAFVAAVANEALHLLEHITFLGTALLLWRAVLAARSARRAAAALGASFATLMHSGLLGGLITLAPTPLYPWYEGRTTPWGLSALGDQQLGGLLMWVPMGAVYFAACLVLTLRLLVSDTLARTEVDPGR